MPRFRQLAGWVGAVVVAVAGCRAPTPHTSAITLLPMPNPPPGPVALASITPQSLEPDWKSLPAYDPLAEPVPAASPETIFRGLSETECRQLAASRTLLSPSNPDEPPLDGELQAHTLDAARNVAAAEALEQFFRLADAEARTAILRESLTELDTLRNTVKRARDTGVRVPTEPAELDRQRVSALGVLNQAELGITLVNIDLKRRIGVAGVGSDRLWPVGPFPMDTNPIDVESAAQQAVERRGDLRLLRATFWRLNPENITAVREHLRSRILGSMPDPFAGFPVLQRMANRRKPALPLPSLDAATRAELLVARQQWFDLIAQRERRAADEVRAAGALLSASVKQVSLARWQVESLTAKVAESKERGPLMELPAKLELLRARGELTAAVYGWHLAKVKWLAAQGIAADAEK